VVNTFLSEVLFLERASRICAVRNYAASGWSPGRALAHRRALLVLMAPALLFAASSAQTAIPSPAVALPDAPQPQSPAKAGAQLSQPCQVQGNSATAASPSCQPQPSKNWFARFLTGPEVKPLTPKEKALLAARNVVDPFNAITILGSSAIAVGSDADSPYGPGMKGFGRSVGVSYTQDLTGEFFGTFLIPSIVHQDPHYHRMPSATIPRRIFHTVVQVVWTQGDNGKPMVNYANLFGYAIGDEISNLYVPGRETNLPASAERYGTGLATAPIDNIVTEFLPDVVRHIHLRVVLIQRIINQVAKTDAAGAS